MIIDWAHADLAPRLINLRLANQTRSAGESITGFEQVAASIATRWRLSLDFNNLKAHTVPSYRAMIAKLEGRANVLRVPIFDRHYQPSDASLGIALADFTDDADFGDGTLFSTADVIGLTASGTAGDRELAVDFGTYESNLRPGQYFGIGDELYIATSVLWSGSTATISFHPGLRQDHAGSTFRLRPRLIMRLTDDEGGALSLEMGKWGSPSLELVEVLPDELSLMESGG